jgi:hypothetical protein
MKAAEGCGRLRKAAEGCGRQMKVKKIKKIAKNEHKGQKDNEGCG